MSKIFQKIGLSLILVVLFRGQTVCADSWATVLRASPSSKGISLEVDVESIRINDSSNAEYRTKAQFPDTSILIFTVEMARDGRRRNLSVSFYNTQGRLVGTQSPGDGNKIDWNWSEPENDEEFELVSKHAGWSAKTPASGESRWVRYASDPKRGYTWSYDRESVSRLSNSAIRIWVRTETGYKMVYTLYPDRTYELADAFGKRAGERLPVPPDSPAERLWLLAFPKRG